MNRQQEVKIDEAESSPNQIKLSDGSYILWDFKEGFFRVAFYQRNTRKGSDLEMTLALAMKKPVHNSKVKSIFNYISRSDEYAAVGS